jgi:cell division protein FtsI/penicillin-binding protein 2
MFERRLKIVLGVLFVSAFVLVARAMHVQVVQRDRWTKLASDSMVIPRLIETTRGKILDRKGRVLAMDDGCIDACVDYRAIKWEPDEEWIKKLALKRILDTRSEQYKAASASQKKQMRETEAAQVKERIKLMWTDLAKLSGKSEAEIQQVRSDIEQRVSMRKRSIWFQRYKRTMNEQDGKEKPAWYRSFLLGEGSDVPEIDVFEQTIAEEAASHVILGAIDTALYNELAKNLDRFPGLELRGSNHRVYQANEIGCHVIGNLGRVMKSDLETARDETGIEEPDRRQYQYNDLIGRTGLESLLEPTLRGTRGKELINPITRQVVKSWPAIPGQDVKCSIDIDLQADIQRLFTHTLVRDTRMEGRKPDVITSMHGAAVVLDVKTNEVLAMVSNPTFNLSELDAKYNEYATNIIDKPLLNRATQAQLEPGSTVKPIVGTGAITNGVLGIHEGIECTGYLMLNGKRQSFGRCWTVAVGAAFGLNPAHHSFDPAPHHGIYGNAYGSLVFSVVRATCSSKTVQTGSGLKNSVRG